VTVQKTADGAIIFPPAAANVTPQAGRPRIQPSRPVIKEDPVDPDEPELSDSDERGPQYSKGTIEQEAYGLLLASNPAIAGLVQGANPSLRFVSWDAASRGEDLYWVRLKFQEQGKPETEYIWQVRLETKQVTPLNYNARTTS
jgi:hypothetical protein